MNMFEFSNVRNFLQDIGEEELIPYEQDDYGYGDLLKHKFVNSLSSLAKAISEGRDFDSNYNLKKDFNWYCESMVYAPHYLGDFLVSLDESLYDDYAEYVITDILKCREDYLKWYS